jgi:hypothetical protein
VRTYLFSLIKGKIRQGMNSATCTTPEGNNPFGLLPLQRAKIDLRDIANVRSNPL